jgi:ABC-type uncharacterized transport system substrate-binding protein
LSVVLKARCVFERIFGGVKRQIRFVILFGGFNGVEAHSHIFLTGTEETAYAHHCRFNLTALVDQKIHDLAELLIVLVFAQVSDPVGAGFVTSLAHPGGNITGFALFEFAIGAKWLELLKQIAPSVTRAAVIYDPANPSATGFLPLIEAAGRSFGVDVFVHSVHDTGEIEGVISALATKPNSGLIALASPLVTQKRDLIISLATRSRLPAIFALRYYAEAGGLASYGVDNLDLYRRAGSYVDRILKGEKPSDLPVQQATKFQLVINLKTAKALGLTVPSALLAAADEVIE